MKIGDKVKYRSSSLEMKRLLDCDIGSARAERIFNGEVGTIIQIEKNGGYSPLDIKIQFKSSNAEISAPANFFFVVQEIPKGHHLTNMFKRDDVKQAF